MWLSGRWIHSSAHSERPIHVYACIHMHLHVCVCVYQNINRHKKFMHVHACIYVCMCVFIHIILKLVSGPYSEL